MCAVEAVQPRKLIELFEGVYLRHHANATFLKLGTPALSFLCRELFKCAMPLSAKTYFENRTSGASVIARKLENVMHDFFVHM